MIASFRCEGTRDIYDGRNSKAGRRVLPQQLHPVASRKLDMIVAAKVLEDLRVPPSNRLEALKGDLRGWHSIRVNDQYRVIFRWKRDGAHSVAIVDYH